MSPTRTTRIRISALAVGFTAAMSLSACGSDAPDTVAASETTTATAETSAASTDTSAASTETSAASSDTASTASETSAAGSGAAAVQGVILTDGEAPADRTITVVGRAFQPDTLTVRVGETVTFKAGDKQISSVIVGDLPGATVTGGLVETFQFSIPGTYPVKEDVSGNTATIIVE